VLDRATSGALRQRRWIWALALTLSASIPTWQLTAPRLGLAPAAVGRQAAVDAPATTAAPSIWVASQNGLAELIARADSGSLGTNARFLSSRHFCTQLPESFFKVADPSHERVVAFAFGHTEGAERLKD